jgi:hypothetical protein
VDPWASLLSAGFVTALRFVALPGFAVLVAISLGWHAKKQTWLPLWKLGLALLVATLVGTLAFALAWRSELYPNRVGFLSPASRAGPGAPARGST